MSCRDRAVGAVFGQREIMTPPRSERHHIAHRDTLQPSAHSLKKMKRVEPSGSTLRLNITGYYLLERLRTKKIPRSFAVGTKEVTVEQFLKYRSDFDYVKQHSREPDAPANNVNWVDAAAYCRWLSEQEKIPEDQMCYPPLDEIKLKTEPGVGFLLKVPDDYLTRTGYRLPTEAEWEYVCKAGTVTEHYFGQTGQLLDAHAWTASNSSVNGLPRLHPVGSLRPNAFGMFDILGNVMEFCQNRHDLENEAEFKVDDVEDQVDIKECIYSAARQLRGGDHLYHPSVSRASHRDNYGRPYSSRANPYFGFRIARTLPKE